MKKKVSFGDTPLSSTGNNIYDDTAKFGKLYVMFLNGIVIILASLFLIWGISLMNKKAIYTLKTTLTVKTSSPVYTNITQTVNGRTTTTPRLTSYNITGTIPECGQRILNLQGYTNVGIVPNVGDTIQAFIKPDKTCGDALYKKDSSFTPGAIMTGISILVIFFMLLNIYLVRNYKAYAAMQGAGVGLSMMPRFNTGFNPLFNSGY